MGDRRCCDKGHLGGFLLGCFIVIDIILFSSCVIVGFSMLLRVFYLPELPSFNVAFTSVYGYFHNISGGDDVRAKLDVALIVNNEDCGSIISYNNITASVFHDGKLLFDVGSDSLLPFEQYRESREVLVSSNDTEIHVDQWATTEDQGKIGISYLYLELKAITRFRGRKLLEHRTPIKVACHNVEVQISSNPTTTTTTTRRFDPMIYCRVHHGPFRKYKIMAATVGGLLGASILGFVIFIALILRCNFANFH